MTTLHQLLTFRPKSDTTVVTDIDQLVNSTNLRLNKRRLTAVPECIGDLTKLKRLSLRDNKISSLPASVGRLTNLVELYIFNNKFTALPDCLSTLTNLEKLYISSNNITVLPPFVTKFQRLSELVIEWRGVVEIEYAPVNITSLPCFQNTAKTHGNTMSISDALRKIKLYSDHVNEGISHVDALIEGWKICQRINLSQNKISSLPKSISTLEQVTQIDISANKMLAFPDALLQMTWLSTLNLSGNLFTELPDGFSKLKMLSKLLISATDGAIAIKRAPKGITTLPCWGRNPDLAQLDLYHTPQAASVLPRVSSVLPASLPPVSVPSVEFTREFDKYMLPTAPAVDANQKLGEGGQASVYKGVYEGQAVALKIIKPDVEDMLIAEQEVILAKTIHHQNILKILGVHICSFGMCIVMELASYSLKELLEDRKDALSNIEIVTFSSQIASALTYCVTQKLNEPIHHRDLKSDNVLIVDGNAKLADFGLAHVRNRSTFSTRLSNTKDGGGEMAGTIHWQGPEIYHSVCKRNLEEDSVGHRGETSDVYSFGSLVWSMSTGLYPLRGKSHAEITMALLNGERPEIPTNMHPTLKHIIMACWRQNYKLRPRFSDISAVLSACGAGNLDGVQDATLSQHLPIQYSAIEDMLPGELYQFFVESDISLQTATNMRQNHMTGALFLRYTVDEFLEEFHVSVQEAETLLRLQSLKLLQSSRLSSSRRSFSLDRTQLMSLSTGKLFSSLSLSPSSTTSSRPSPPQPIVDMDNQDLVAYLRGQRGFLDSFVTSLKEAEVTGEAFMWLIDKEMLSSAPFNLKAFQLEATWKAIQEIRLL